MQRRRFMADRFQRIWSIVERIDQQPGLGRRQLSEEFALSERQLQADLEVIRLEMGLPLSRRQGYRFDGRADPNGSLGLLDAITLARLVRAQTDPPTVPPRGWETSSRVSPRPFPPAFSRLPAPCCATQPSATIMLLPFSWSWPMRSFVSSSFGSAR